MEEIKIALSEVSHAAQQLRTYNTSLDEILAYVSRTMNDLNSIWMSDGQEMLISRFHRFASRFTDESEVIRSYADFLDNTVADYDSLESTIVANAASFD